MTGTFAGESTVVTVDGSLFKSMTVLGKEELPKTLLVVLSW